MWSLMSALFALVAVVVGVYALVETSGFFPPIFCGVLKSLPAVICAISTLRCYSQTQGKERVRLDVAFKYCLSIGFGLLFCAGGDFLLRLDKAGLSCTPSYFIWGLLSFLLGHILFTFAFWFDGGNGLQVRWGFLIFGYMSIYLFQILQRIPETDLVLRIGVTAYCLIIGSMCHRSLSLSLDAYPRVGSASSAVYGSVLFVVSDSLLAYNRFISPIPFDYIWVLGTYYCALVCLANSSDGFSRWAAGWQ